jgi:hypothetical protein
MGRGMGRGPPGPDPYYLKAVKDRIKELKKPKKE